MSPVDRRTFLRDLAAASAAAAGASVLPLRAGDAHGSPPAAPQGPAWMKAPCNLCAVGCGLLVGIEKGRAVAVKGDPDSPVSRGLACVKGYHAVQALYGQDRITRAMVRSNGRLVPVALAEALDVVAARIRDTAARHGRESVAVYGPAMGSLTDAYVAAKLFGGALQSTAVDDAGRLRGASARAGLVGSFGLEGVPGCFEDIDHADVFVLWNGNLAETAPVLFSRMLERRRTSPAVRIIALTTRATRTSYAADETLHYAPQTEVAIANALCHEVVSRKWARRDFIDRHVAFRRGTRRPLARPQDMLAPEQAADATWNDYVSFLSSYTPERAQAVSGVPAESIRWLASVYADGARNVMSLWDEGVDGHAGGMWTNNALHNIHLLVGKVAAPGNGALPVDASPGIRAAAQPAGPPRPARDAVAMFDALDRGDVRFLWVQGANPMVSLPNVLRYRRAAAHEDRFVVVSAAYPTPTTDIADVVLPAALWVERQGMVVNAERRVQVVERLVAPPGDAASDSSHMIEVARRLGHGRLFPWDRAREAAGIWEEYRRTQEGPQRALASTAELRRGSGALWPHPAGRDTRWRFNTAHDPAADRAHGGYDFYGHPDHRAWIWLRPYQPAAEVPDRSYPFWLEIGSVLEHSGTGTLTQRIPVLHRAVPRAYVEMNRQDATRLGIRHGEVVRLVSRRGALQIEARIDYRSQPRAGQLFVPAFDEGRPVNALTSDARCPHSGQPESGGCAVRIERMQAGGGA